MGITQANQTFLSTQQDCCSKTWDTANLVATIWLLPWGEG